MRVSSLTALGAILSILVGAAVFAAAIVTRVHGATLIGLALIGIGIVLACQPGESSERHHGTTH
ncbi:MAG: hypothetical protein IRZ14_08835 [Chloroflexi bacterium]|jgi:hypothetical protein|nr:hypothetical protein [Chloroflexota bacterium]